MTDLIKGKLEYVPRDLCFHSAFNTRKTRDAKQIKRLAERISKFGFEETRALWVRPVDGRYEVFAGGMRLEAANLADVSPDIPVIPHKDCSDDEVAFLAEYDNENDEYHTPVSPVDIWAEYARLKSLGWTQQRIADAKNVTKGTVSKRITFNSVSDKVKGFVSQCLLSEFHLEEICSCFAAKHLSPWFTTQQVWEELAQKAVNDRAKNGNKSREAVKKDVENWRLFITYAEQVFDSLPEGQTLYDLSSEPPAPYTYRPREQFIKLLADRSVRSLPKVKVAEKEVRDFIANELASYSKYIELKSTHAAKEAERLQQEAELRERFLFGDARSLVTTVESPVSLILTDPSWGHNYQSNRRWASAPPPQMAGDTPKEALKLLGEVLTLLLTKLAADAHILVFAGWQQEPQVRALLENLGLEVKGSLIWAKEEHTAGDVKGSFAPSHERIIHAVKGTPAVSPRIRDVIEESRTRETSHPAEKPLKLLEKLITSTTEEGEMVVDPFAGCASTLVAAYRKKRQFWGCEIEEDYWEEGQQRLLEVLKRV